MDATIAKSVREIPADEKKALEEMLGASLEVGEHVFVWSYTPGALPSDAARANSRRGIEEILSANQAFAKKQGTTPAEADDAVAEARRQTRRRA